MRELKKRVNLKGIISLVLTFVLLFGAIGGIVALSRRDTKVIKASSFKVGMLDDDGKHKASDKSIYTKEAFPCEGLRVEPDFEFKGTYSVYYYDEDERLLDKVTGLSGVYDEDHYFAYYARIVITPDAPEDVEEKDFKIHWYNAYKYAKGVKITVNKRQGNAFVSDNLYVEEKVIVGKSVDEVKIGEQLVLIDGGTDSKVIEGIAVERNYKTLHVYLKRTEASTFYSFGIYLSKNNVILASHDHDLTDVAAGEWCLYTFDVPEYEEGMTFTMRLPSDASCRIYACSGCPTCD